MRSVPTIRFDAALYTIDKWTILRLPEKASGKLPSRGQVAVQGTINGHEFQTRLHLSVKTVEAHVSSVLRKLQLSSRHELTRWAHERRLV